MRNLARPNQNILTQKTPLDSRAEIAKTLTTKLGNSSPLIAAIEDSNSFRQILQHILTDAGFRFVSIPDPLNAPVTLLKIKPTLILLDVMMPQINGYQLCSHLRQLTPLQKTPIIFLSAKEGIIECVRARW